MIKKLDKIKKNILDFFVAFNFQFCDKTPFLLHLVELFKYLYLVTS